MSIALISFMGGMMLAPEATAGWSAINDLRNEVAICVVQNSVRLDDHQTSPDIVVRGAKAACSEKLRVLKEAIIAQGASDLATLPASDREQLTSKTYNDMVSHVGELSIQAVLEERKRRAANQ